MYYNQLWGTICDDHWGIEDANVVCRMLGFPGALKAVNNEVVPSVFASGMGPIYLDNVKCLGTESSIAECHHKGWSNHNCEHSEDAGVICLNVNTSKFSSF